MPGTTSDFGAFQQPIIFFFRDSESVVISGEKSRTTPVPGHKEHLVLAFTKDTRGFVCIPIRHTSSVNSRD